MDESKFNATDEVVQFLNTDQTQFRKNYEQLLAGVNRIRYLKTKQKRNQLKMMQYLNTIKNNLESKKENQSQSTSKSNQSFRVPILNVRKSAQLKQNRSPYKNVTAFEGCQTLRIKTEPQKLFHYSFQAKFKNGCLDSKPTEATMLNSSIMPELNQSNKQKLAELLLKKKAQNYHQMKKLRLKNQQEERQNQQALLQAARIRREAVRTSCENGRKKIHQQYFQHLQTIKQAKMEEKQKKMRITQKKFQQLVELQKNEREELEKYEHSLIMESNLKELIERAGRQSSKLGWVLRSKFQ